MIVRQNDVGRAKYTGRGAARPAVAPNILFSFAGVSYVNRNYGARRINELKVSDAYAVAGLVAGSLALYALARKYWPSMKSRIRRTAESTEDGMREYVDSERGLIEEYNSGMADASRDLQRVDVRDEKASTQVEAAEKKIEIYKELKEDSQSDLRYQQRTARRRDMFRKSALF